MKLSRVFVFAFGLTMLSCAGSSPSQPTPTPQGVSRFSGVWKGTLTVAQIGGCAYNGDPIAVTMQWVVTDGGLLTVTEPESKITWTDGRVASDWHWRLPETAWPYVRKARARTQPAMPAPFDPRAASTKPT